MKRAVAADRHGHRASDLGEPSCTAHFRARCPSRRRAGLRRARPSSPRAMTALAALRQCPRRARRGNPRRAAPRRTNQTKVAAELAGSRNPNGRRQNQRSRPFRRRPAPNIFLYLVFGTDAGLVAERREQDRRPQHRRSQGSVPIPAARGDDLAADPLRLADEANTIAAVRRPARDRRSMRRARAFIAALEPVLAAPPRDCTIVIEAGALKRDAPLRKLCEGSAKARRRSNAIAGFRQGYRRCSSTPSCAPLI